MEIRMSEHETTVDTWSDECASEAGFDAEDDGLTIWDDARCNHPMSARWFSWREARRMHAWLSKKIKEHQDV
jgi:hypothetical protein